MIKWVRTAIIYIDLIVTGSEAHTHKASQGGGNVHNEVKVKVKVFYLSIVQCNTGSYWAVKFLGQGKQKLRSKEKYN